MPGALSDLEGLLSELGERLGQSLQLAHSSAQAITRAAGGLEQAGALGLLGRLDELRHLVSQVSDTTEAAKGKAHEALNFTVMLRT